METKQPRTFRVLMFPWLAYGHISPYFELAKKLAHRNFNIYLCSTPINLNPIRKILSKPSSNLSINLVELHLPSSPELPPHFHTTNGLPPHLMATLIGAFETASSSFSSIINSLQPELIIYDINQPWVPQMALVHNIPAVHFQITAVTSVAFFLRLFRHRGVEFPSSAIFLKEFEMKKLARAGSTSNAGKDKDRVFQCIDRSSEVILIKSCEEIEGKYIDFLSFLTKKKIVPVGSLVQDPVEVDEDDESLKIIQWLNEKPQGSTLFVSCGSECFLSKVEIEEIARGLDYSNVNFIWVIRFPSGEKTNIQEVLPDGYLENVKGKGLILEGWAPQVRILAHSSIGGFVSHCGWSSMMESIHFGVPIIAMPMQLDQPLIARLMVEIGVGMEIICDEQGMLKAEEIARVIKEVVLEKNGEDIRTKVKELSERIQANSQQEINAVVEQLAQLVVRREIGE